MKTTIKQLFGALIVTAFSLSLNAQQEVQSSLYMFNPSILNPAYAGSRDALSGVADYHQQWVKWNGAPTTNFCFNAPVDLYVPSPTLPLTLNMYPRAFKSLDSELSL